MVPWECCSDAKGTSRSHGCILGATARDGKNDMKTLKSRGFAKVSSPPELLPDRERLLSTPMATVFLSLKGDAPIKVHRPGGIATGCRQALWLLSDLQKTLPRWGQKSPEALQPLVIWKWWLRAVFVEFFQACADKKTYAQEVSN